VEHASSVQAGQGIEERFREIDALVEANRANRDPELERQILRLRHHVGIELMSNGTAVPRWPDIVDAASPEITPDELTPQRLRASMLRHGYLLIRGLLDPDEAHRIADEIEQAFQAFEAHEAGEPVPPALYEEFKPEPPFRLAQRGWVNTASGIWGADSPRVMFSALDAMDRAGLRQLATDYLGERPAISVDKCTLRRVHPDFLPGNNYSAWHQDGAFLGDVRALNVWLALSRCGDVAPGLDIVPRRLDFIAETGSEGTAFSWSVSEQVAAEVAGDTGIQRPIFEAGDVMLFDELFLHSTAADPGMTQTRYAVETWFFGPSAFPADYTPLAF
jgi:Phytanoyl-CoA dioxygenase (PhyH)